MPGMGMHMPNFDPVQDFHSRTIFQVMVQMERGRSTVPGIRHPRHLLGLEKTTNMKKPTNIWPIGLGYKMLGSTLVTSHRHWPVTQKMQRQLWWLSEKNSSVLVFYENTKLSIVFCAIHEYVKFNKIVLILIIDLAKGLENVVWFRMEISY